MLVVWSVNGDSSSHTSKASAKVNLLKMILTNEFVQLQLCHSSGQIEQGVHNIRICSKGNIFGESSGRASL